MLALIALLVAVAVPEFVKLYTRVRFSFERDDLERELSELPQRVRALGRGGILLDPSAQGLAADAAGPARDRMGAWRPLRLDLPEGWQIEVPKPIYYHSTGACDGGIVMFTLPPFSLRYLLRPPLCQPEEQNAAFR